MRDILITGGAGFIGSNLIKKLLTEGKVNITCVDNFDDFYSRKVKEHNIASFINHPNFKLFEFDLADYKNINHFLTKKFDTIIHLAGKAGVRPSIEQPQAYQRANVDATQNLLEFAKNQGIKQFIFASSSSVYGINPNTPWKEDEPLMPISPYASTKLSCEQLGHVYSHLYDIRFLALRFFTVYGPAQRPDLAIHKFFKSILNEAAIPVFGDGNTSRDYTYIDDILQGIIACIDYDKSNYEIINLGNSDTVTLSHLIESIEKTCNKKAIINRMPMQPGDVPKTFADVGKAHRLLGYRPTTKLTEGLKKFYEWYTSTN
ncbi:GDP-mannose 4,6-dehydratase [Solitalea canadensis]|uniref:Nucleoside-diphosphate-sugar epimerase n=1 Tax=Solitalea canadensis (strain ATCC 29591 / DSM 3403 / JCM 21819 / LMG 8368 / NBRC 15130 / NCIMB 12057 / USAM 9D) TaxID=929556 RepID=H8KSM3_SOLCM|nr:GDP-mannose 4,6-dehydratase [Solitalea canadensis]AFD08574.1 nucleoside-diphosphate-sugar epimerase [Solitalea canadensis DSM 3403]